MHKAIRGEPDAPALEPDEQTAAEPIDFHPTSVDVHGIWKECRLWTWEVRRFTAAYPEQPPAPIKFDTSTPETVTIPRRDDGNVDTKTLANNLATMLGPEEAKEVIDQLNLAATSDGPVV